MTAAKFVEGPDGEWFVEGIILPMGGPLDGNDLTGTRFTPDTDFCLEWFPAGGRPGLYAHGYDAALRASVVGREVSSWEDDHKNRWLRGQLDKRHEYASEIKQLLDEGALSLSSGAVDHLVKATKDGAIRMWPWVEWSLVTNPANPEAVAYAVKSTDAVAHLAIRSSASEDVNEALMVRGMLTDLLSDETAENQPEQAAIIRRAIALVDRFIAAETAEIGTPEDASATDAESMDAEMSADRAIKDLPLTPQALHDAAVASGAACSHAEHSEPAPLLAPAGKSVETDLDALADRLAATAAAAAVAAVKARL